MRKSTEESIIHRLRDCPKTQALIESFKNIITKGLNIIFEKASFILEKIFTKEMYIISLIIKSYIYIQETGKGIYKKIYRLSVIDRS